ncbi:hypothetical protein BDF21DRAFT_395376 [Thamnidium elegans]|nr:hypothetical protein BDF21DRAFT_395376 [Thamnidium elegans]
MKNKNKEVKIVFICLFQFNFEKCSKLSSNFVPIYFHLRVDALSIKLLTKEVVENEKVSKQYAISDIIWTYFYSVISKNKIKNFNETLMNEQFGKINRFFRRSITIAAMRIMLLIGFFNKRQFKQSSSFMIKAIEQ